jgi:PAS domain S-box-containing protein
MYENIQLSARETIADLPRRLEVVLDNATVAIMLMDDRQHCVYMNRAAEELTGYTLEEVLALDKPMHDIVHHTYPDGRPFPLHECAIDRAFPERNRMAGEEVFVHKDGSFYPVAFCASPIRDFASKTIGTIVEVRDISRDKRAQEQQRLLVNELNHRVKNTLATVQSLAVQTFRGADPAAVEKFNNRLLALAKAHDILTVTTWDHAPLKNIFCSVMEPFGLERFEVEGPHIMISPKAALSLAMVIHELATNASKYGALSVSRGRVHVHWEEESLSSGSQLDLTWEERGGPAVLPPARRGFGTGLIERQIAIEFGGSASLDFRPSGLVCRIRLVRAPGSQAWKTASEGGA